MARPLTSAVLPLVVAAAAMAMTARADHPVKGEVPWDHVGNARFRVHLDRIAGEHAVDCGFIVLVGRQPSRQERREVLGCIAGAKRRGEAFKYGTARVPLDSFADEVYVQDATGQAWLLVYDEMPLQDGVQFWVQSCKSVSVHPRTLIITGNDCSDHMDGSEAE